MSGESPPPADLVGAPLPASPLTADSAADPVAAPRWVAGPFLVAYFALFAFGIGDNARGPVFPDVLRDLKLDDSQGSLLFAITSAGTIAASVTGARLIARVGALNVLTLALAIMSLGLGAMGAARGLPSLLGASFVFGVACGWTAVSQNVLVERSVAPDLRRRAFSGLHSMYGIASLLAPLAVAAGMHLSGSWRACLVALAVAPLLLVGACLLPQVRGAALRPRPAKSQRRGFLSLGSGPWWIALSAGCCVVAELLLSTRLVLLLERSGSTPDEAKLALSAFFACLLLGRILVSTLTLPWSNRAILCASGVSGVVLFGLGVAWEPRLLPLVGLAVAPYFPVATALLADEFEDRLDESLGLLISLGATLLVFAHVGVGWLSDAFDLQRALAAGPIALCVSLVCLGFSARGARAQK